MLGRFFALLVVCTVAAACGSDANTTAASSAASIPSSTAAPTPTPTQLVVPDDCHPDGSALEISALNGDWLGADGDPLAPGEACLAVGTGPFTVTLHNDVQQEGSTLYHSFNVYRDATASKRLFAGDPILSGHSFTYHLHALPAGVYLFRCDVHPETMTGVLVVQ